MRKIILWALFCAMLLCPSASLAEPSPTPAVPEQEAQNSELITYRSTGERVVRIQLRLRELGYFNYKPTGSFQNMSVQAAIDFQQMQVDANGQPIMADGSIGAQSMDILFSHTAKRVDIVASIPFGPQLTGTPSIVGSVVSWNEVKGLLSEGSQYTFTDFNTGSTFAMTLVSVDAHAEMECATALDTQTFLTCFGGAFNYSKRPVVMHVGDRLIAASMQGQPHGQDTVPANDMSGNVCVYFSESLSHVGALPDVEHMNQVRKAAGQ
ncbi:MAG: peptidoglycan-binding domain-containing protein [Clostridia bacterium]|nr:peptidoglycan-binding domain-containing protein [Clostridia bacterium]